MYFDDFEYDLGLSNSFDAIVSDELGQEINVQVDIPSSQLPTPTEIEVIEATGETPTLTGLPGHANRQRIDIIPEIAEEIEARRGRGEDVDVKQLSEQMLQEHKEAQVLAKYEQVAKAAEAAGMNIPGAPSPTSSGMSGPVVIQTPGETPEFAGLVRKDMIEEIVKNLTQRLIPRLNAIDKRLKLAQAQAQATDEHNIIMDRELFRQQVVNELKWLSQILPSNHPVRLQIDRL